MSDEEQIKYSTSKPSPPPAIKPVPVGPTTRYSVNNGHLQATQVGDGEVDNHPGQTISTQNQANYQAQMQEN